MATAAVAASIHGRRQEVGTGEAADKDRDEQSPEASGALYGAPLVEGNPAGGLGAGEAFNLPDKDGDELYRDHEHQHQLVDRYAEPLRGAEDQLQAVGQVYEGGR